MPPNVVQKSRENPAGRGMSATVSCWIGMWPKAYLLQVGDNPFYNLLTDGTFARISPDRLAGKDEETVSAITDVKEWAIGGTEPEPLFTRLDQARGRVGLMCTKGLTRHVTDAQIAGRLRSMTSARQACEDLLQDALDAGGDDNVTIIVGRDRVSED